jgi:hypothetical protein
LIIAFEFKHPIGCVCRFPCKWCGETDQRTPVSDTFKNVTVAPPMFILREAAREEHLADCIANGAKNPKHNPKDYFYEVSMD